MRLKESELKEGQVICPECEGTKIRVYSCCTGEHVSNDEMICPECYEHLGEENCMTCDGEGWITEHEAILGGSHSPVS